MHGACSEVQVTESWNGGYKAQFHAAAQSDSVGVTIKMTFDNAITDFQVTRVTFILILNFNIEFTSQINFHYKKLYM